MAEAFGIAGSAFGTVSLGLQLFTEISKYLNSVEGRDEDLERAKNYARDFQSSLIALETWASNTRISDADLERAISQGQANCEMAINDLSKTISDLKGQDPIPDSRTSKARFLYVKLKYPFKKQNLENLEKQLFNTISILQFALVILQARSIHVTQMSIQDIHQMLGNILARPSETYRANCNNSPVHMVENIVETAVDSAVCLRDPTPNTLESGIQSTRYQNGSFWTMNSFCFCRKSYKRCEQRQWGPFIVEKEISFTDYHSPGCSFSTQEPIKEQTKRTLKFPIPFSQRHWRNISQFSLFFTAGTGGMSLGQHLTWVTTVDSLQSPSFRIVELAMNVGRLSTDSDREVFLWSCSRRLKSCFADKSASITDVDKFGRSIVDYVTYRHCLFSSGEQCFVDEALQVFYMMAPFINPATHPKSTTSSPVLAQLCQNIITPNSKISGEMISSLLSRCGDSAGQDCKSPFLENSLQEQFHLVKDFPEISNYLEFGQLSRLVLVEDQDRVIGFLEQYPSSINEINHLGQTPVHIAVQTQNSTILRVLINHADRKVLNTKDNNGHYAIDHAIDALCHALKSKKESGPNVCHGCEVLNLLLHSESAIFTCTVRRALRLPWHHNTHMCIEGQKNIIQSLASRRQELKTLAQRKLTPPERQTLKLCQPGILDQNAAQTQEFLEANKCHIPMHLKVYDDDENPEDSESIYLLISHGDVAESALQNGFLMPKTLFDDVFRLVPKWLDSMNSGYRSQDFLFSSFICWLVDHGGELHSTVPTPWGRTTAAHYFMAYLGNSQWSFQLGHRVPLSPKVSSIIFEEDNVDDCRCRCSPKGCTPLTKFLAAINCYQYWVFTLGISETISIALKHLEYMCGLLRHIGYDLATERWFDSAAVRHATFFILDLRHTCCCLGNGGGSYATSPLSRADRLEIEEEDNSRLELFEKLIMDFERERGNYADLLSFAREYWAPKMEAAYREIDSYLLTETQIQSAEAAGVVWECYGPHIPVDTEEEEEISELEKMLRMLDEIATDPERPSLL
ncbi:uncharacterized protein FPRO_01958 [Fusarium proliferatum ET1]|uniref:Uncharacterized protein n=1 Tax=Fusarium proliferatum (strain ET1) TaxID=1227346 RepID=A0A1L7UZN4_FUSPR|nr:uncharacterized protein FPRO_01958 [Fusarium proliferatum ET1]CZR32753.1 uncharacterized protein FPRO_01958 [Fusarium proliferatum ET1]